MGIGERIKQGIQGLRETARHKLDEMDKEDKEYKKGREVHKQDVKRGDEEAAKVDAIAERHRLRKDKSVKGRLWITDQKYVDVDPRHPGTAERLEKVVNQQKSEIQVRTARPPKAAALRPGRAKVSKAAQQGDLGFKPRIHGKRPVDPTPDMPPYPGGYVMDAGFIGGGGFMGGGGDFIPGAPKGGQRKNGGKKR